jgi:Na+/phosphate symporter
LEAILKSLIQSIGGIGVFLLGMIVITEGLQSLAGPRYVRSLDKTLLKEPGIALTAALQSMSGQFKASDLGSLEMQQ